MYWPTIGQEDIPCKLTRSFERWRQIPDVATNIALETDITLGQISSRMFIHVTYNTETSDLILEFLCPNIRNEIVCST